MKTTYAVLSSLEQRIELREKEIEAREDEVLVRIHACGICQGDVALYAKSNEQVEAFGHEPFGQVIECGPWVRHLKEGDWVTSDIYGSFATHIVGSEADFIKISPELGETACLAEPLKCVTSVVRAAAPDLSDIVVVMGCGFMGLASIAALAGGWQKQLIAVDMDASRRNLALELGATVAVDPADGDVEAQVRGLTGDRMADVSIDFANNHDAAMLAGRLLRTRGRLVVASGYLPHDTGRNLYARAITILPAPPAISPDVKDDYRRAIDAMESGRFPLNRLVSHRYSFSHIQQAFETARQGAKAGYIKGIVLMGDSQL